ncbi:MAG: hypothetical protein KF871_12205 [Hydrogenophaga sp.]|uniref:hypothetical protein n=1 Tax=Hydrogenophaga sp. TaxID=1904254 RepID=UPI001D54A6F4|nr:hypothetical protein [Hydrogenophaga sp.]MBX3610648.1 hypothetical protein [Hydrogenophaga sp.]
MIKDKTHRTSVSSTGTSQPFEQAPPRSAEARIDKVQVHQTTNDKGHLRLTMTLPVHELGAQQTQQFKAMVSMKLATLYPGRLQPAQPNTPPDKHVIDLDLSFFERWDVENTLTMLDTAFKVTRTFGWSSQVLEAVLDNPSTSVQHPSDLGVIIEGHNDERVRAVPGMNEDQAGAFAKLCLSLAGDRAVPRGAPLMLDLLTKTLREPHAPSTHRMLLAATLKTLDLCRDLHNADLAGKLLERLALCVTTAHAQLPTQDPLRTQLAEAGDFILQKYNDGESLLAHHVLSLLNAHIDDAPQHTHTSLLEQEPVDALVESTATRLFDQCAGLRTGRRVIEQLLHLVQSIPGEAAQTLRQELFDRTQYFSETEILGERSAGAEDRARLALSEKGLDVSIGWVNGSLSLRLDQEFIPDRHADLLAAYGQACTLDFATLVFRFLLAQPGLSSNHRRVALEAALRVSSSNPGDTPLPVDQRDALIQLVMYALREHPGDANNLPICSSLCDRLLELNNPELVAGALGLELGDDAACQLLLVGMEVLLAQPDGIPWRYADAWRASAERLIGVMEETAHNSFVAILDARLARQGLKGKSLTLRDLCRPHIQASGGGLQAVSKLWRKLCELHVALHMVKDPAKAVTRPIDEALMPLKILCTADPLVNARVLLASVQALLRIDCPDTDQLHRLRVRFESNHEIPNNAFANILLQEIAAREVANDKKSLRAALCCMLMCAVPWSPSVAQDPQLKQTLGLLFEELIACGYARMAAHFLVQIQQGLRHAPVLWEVKSGDHAHAELASRLASALHENRADFAGEAEREWTTAMAACLAHLGDNYEFAPEWWRHMLQYATHHRLRAITAITTLSLQATSRTSPLNSLLAHQAWQSEHFLDKVSVWTQAGLNAVLAILSGLIADEGKTGDKRLGLPWGAPPIEWLGDTTVLHPQFPGTPDEPEASVARQWPAAKPYLVLTHMLISNFKDLSPQHETRVLIDKCLRQLVADLCLPVFDDGSTKPSDVVAMHEAIASLIQHDLDHWIYEPDDDSF